MTKRLAIALLLIPLTAAAAPQAGAGANAGPGANAGDDARMERFSKRMKLARVLGLAEALDLNEAEALKMRDVMTRFDAQRKPLFKELRDNARLVHRAAEGDKDAVAQVDQAVQRIFDAREKMHAIDREMYQALAKDLTPARRARLAVFFARFHQRMGHMMMEHRFGHGGMGPGCGMGEGCGMGPGGGMGHGGRGMRGMRGPGPGPTEGPGMNGPGPDAEPGDEPFGDQ